MYLSQKSLCTSMWASNIATSFYLSFLFWKLTICGIQKDESVINVNLNYKSDIIVTQECIPVGLQWPSLLQAHPPACIILGTVPSPTLHVPLPCTPFIIHTPCHACLPPRIPPFATHAPLHNTPPPWTGFLTDA